MDKEGRVKYGSKEYFDKMNRWKIFFDHHYKNNKHHPEHFRDNIDGMNLVDLIELFVIYKVMLSSPLLTRPWTFLITMPKGFI